MSCGTQVDVPQEPPRIARHFNAGFARQGPRVPQGRLTTAARQFSRPGRTQPSIGQFPALKCRAMVGKSLRDLIAPIFALLLFFACAVQAEPSNALADAELQGHALAQKILAQRPANNYTNTGVLEIRDGQGKRIAIPVRFQVLAGETNWQSVYSTAITNSINGDLTFGRTYFSQLTVIHSAGQRNLYKVPNVNPPPAVANLPICLAGDQIMTPFARSDFWIADLGLEFFHWPQQKILKKEFHRQCACAVLESTNPHPSASSYSRVVCWIDEDSLGIVEAYAYDAKGKKLKNFYPKNLEKVRGQYQVESMIMENLQTGSSSRLDFDLDQ
jgi:hypothetical protein